jgi:hypothetical protein
MERSFHAHTPTGIHDSLYRTVSCDITSLARTATDAAMPQIAAMREEKIEAPAPA